jgi:hypothetical protein
LSKDTNLIEDLKKQLEEAKDQMAVKDLQVEKSKIVNCNLEE